MVAVVAVVVASAAVAVVLRARGPDSEARAGGAPSSVRPSTVPTVSGTARPPTAAVRPDSRTEVGFVWVPLAGWRRSAVSPSNVHYHSPDGAQEIAGGHILARGAELLTQWENFEKESRDVEDYKKIRLERTTFQGRPAVIWEYTFTQQGKPRQGRQIGFNAGGKSYQINVWYEIPARAEAPRNYTRVTDSFVPL